MIIHECCPWSTTKVNSIKKKHKNVIVSTRKCDFRNISCIFSILGALKLHFVFEDVVSIKYSAFLSKT